MTIKLVASIFFIGYLGLSQVPRTDVAHDFARLNLGPHGFEFSYELPFSENIIWENNIGIGMGMEAIGDSPSFTLYFDRPTPFAKSQLKWLYNRNRRRLKGKNVTNNSGNYIGVQSKYSFGNTRLFDVNQAILTEIHWGFQRSLGGRFLFNLQLGLGVLSDLDFSNSVFTPTFGLRFGYRIF